MNLALNEAVVASGALNLNAAAIITELTDSLVAARVPTHFIGEDWCASVAQRALDALGYDPPGDHKRTVAGWPAGSVQKQVTKEVLGPGAGSVLLQAP